MSEPFIGEIRLFSFPFAPRGWAFCDGQVLPIHQNQALYSILGTTYGGNGQTTFALPDLRGRVPVQPWNSITLGQHGGEEGHALTALEMPPHNHLAQGSLDSATSSNPDGNVWASAGTALYSQSINAYMSSSALASTGKSLPHNNMQPYTVLNYCIALEGIFPSRS